MDRIFILSIIVEHKGAKLKLLLQQFVTKLKSEEVAQIVYMIDLINKNYKNA